MMGLMLGEFVDDYTVRCTDVFAMPQSGTGVSVEAVDPVFQTKMLDMLKQTGRCVTRTHRVDLTERVNVGRCWKGPAALKRYPPPDATRVCHVPYDKPVTVRNAATRPALARGRDALIHPRARRYFRRVW